MKRIALLAFTLIVIYCGLLCFPQPFFVTSVRAGNLTLRSDQPLPEAAAKHVLRLAAAKLEASPLYSTRQEHVIYLCNTHWRRMLFFNYRDGVGGVNYYPFTTNVFLREARVSANRLISPGGTPVSGERTLDYFIAHEIAHSITGQAVGPWQWWRMPRWVREGYADFVGKGHDFDLALAKKAFLAGVPEMDPQKSGLYWRYHLLVAQVLIVSGWNVQRLLAHPPEQTSVEELLRESASK